MQYYEPRFDHSRMIKGFLTHNVYCDALKALGLTRVEAAHLLGVDVRTSRRWATGERAIPIPVSRLLRLMIVARISPKRVAKLLHLPAIGSKLVDQP